MYQETTRHMYARFGVYALFIFILSNLAILDYSLHQRNTIPVSQIRTDSYTTSVPNQSAIPEQPGVVECTGDCLVKIDARIKEATSSIKFVLPPQNQPVPTTTNVVTQQTIINSSIKEVFIPFGSTTNATDDWVNTGLAVTIDSTKYTSIKSVTFEAGIFIPTGNETAYVRLYNATDAHPVWFSDVSASGGTSQLVISPSITLDGGSKTYYVQMKTSLKFQANLTEARLHIVLN